MNTSSIFPLRRLISFALPLAALAATSLCGQAKPAAERSRAVLVRPVILCDDDGTNPARFALPKKLIDQVYTRADLEFLYLDPVRWNNGRARRGEINLNNVVKQGHANGNISTDPRIATLLFVSAVDGKTQPLGRGLQGGNICFVNLGKPGQMATSAVRSFVVGHEVGHCLNLRHVVDDPKVPNDVPNLQGEGSFEARLAVEGLHPTQAKTVISSPLALDRIHFHSAKETARIVANDVWDNPLDTLGPDNIRFELGLDPGASLPESTEARLAVARPKYRALADEFTEEDIAMLTARIEKLETLIGEQWPAITRIPWQLAKMQNGFCRGMPHTRGISIVLSDRIIAKFREDEDEAMEVLLHEKLHVIQRLMPGRFEEAFRGYGYEPVDLPATLATRCKLVRNPDAPQPKWAIRHEGDLLLLVTTLENVEGKLKFVEKIHPVIATPNGPTAHDVDAPLADTSRLAAWRKRFPIPVGHDDPREVMAYQLVNVFRTDHLGKTIEGLTDAQRELIDIERKRFPEMLDLIAQESPSGEINAEGK